MPQPNPMRLTAIIYKPADPASSFKLKIKTGAASSFFQLANHGPTETDPATGTPYPEGEFELEVQPGVYGVRSTGTVTIENLDPAKLLVVSIVGKDPWPPPPPSLVGVTGFAGFASDSDLQARFAKFGLLDDFVKLYSK